MKSGRKSRFTSLLHLWGLALLLGMAGCGRARVAASAFSPPGEPIYAVDFADGPEDWCTPYSESYGDFYCRNGELNVVAHPEQESLGAGYYTNDTLKEVAVQAEMRSVESPAPYGVQFRGHGNHFYAFLVRGAGDFRLIALVDGIVELLPWTPSTAIHKGGNTNLLQVTAQGSRITLFANGQVLVTVTDDTFSEGNPGVMVTDGGHAAIRSIRVWRLP